MRSELPFVSVVIPTWDRAPMLADCLTSLRAQDYPKDRFELIVVDDGSTDATPDIVRSFQEGGLPEVRYIRQEHKGPNAARNAAITAARGDPLCFVDDDVEAPSGWLRELVAGALRHSEAWAVGGPVRVRFEGNPPRFCGREPLVGEGELDLGSDERTVGQVNGGNMAVRGWALQKVGLFDESLPIYGDELEWEKRLAKAGHPIMYIPSAWLWHRRTGDLRFATFLNRYVRRGINYVAFAQRTGEEVSVRRVPSRMCSYLAHAVRRRCTMGILMMAQQIGVLWGLLREWVRRG